MALNMMAIKRCCFGLWAASSVYATRMIVVAISLTLSPAVVAQISDFDFYAPRTTAHDIQRYDNVMSHHLAPGIEQTRLGQYTGALAHFEFILRYYSNQPQTLIALSELCDKWKSPVCDQAADRWFRKAIDRNPGASQSYVVMAMHLHRKNKLDEAVKYYKQAIDLAPNSINAHYNLGLAYTDLKQFELANQHAQVAYSRGVTLPALRTRLQKVGKWDPNISLPTFENKSATSAEPSAQASEEKKPE